MIRLVNEVALTRLAFAGILSRNWFAFAKRALDGGVWPAVNRAGILAPPNLHRFPICWLTEMERELPQGYFDETKATARLPNLDIEIVRSRSPTEDAERITIILQAAPSFAAFGRFLEATNPFLFWVRCAQTAWTPWLGAAAASLPSTNFGRLPATAEFAGPDSTSHSEGEG
jgi:hypothetical protein